MSKAELLSPAGDLESLRAAVNYGADAVYLGGKAYGMRAGAKNFDEKELREAVRYAHARGVKVYLACNTIPDALETERFPAFITTADKAGVDAVIAADLGIMALTREYAPRLALHASTQTGIVSAAAANELYKLGARRVVLARELDLAAIKRVRDNIPADMEIEVFVHGAMCVSFSGRCLLSEYFTGRSANKGECAQSCRWGYYLMEEKRPGEFYKITEDEHGTFILNARDMCMIEHLGDVLAAGAVSLKIEGRGKSAYYTALTTNAYRAALDAAMAGEAPPAWAVSEVDKISHRPYCTGFFYSKPSEGSGSQDPKKLTGGGQYFEDSGYIREYDFVATADSCEGGVMRLTTRNFFTVHDELELIPPKSPPIPFAPAELIDSTGAVTDTARHAMEQLTTKTEIVVPSGTFIRRKLK